MKKLGIIKIRKYIVVILFLMLVIISVNIWFYRNFKHQALEINDYVKVQTVNRISDFYEQVNSFVLGTISTEEFTRLQSLSDRNAVYRSQNSIDLIHKINTISRSSSMIKKMYIYLENPDVVLCSSGILEPELFYEIEGKKHFNSYDEWQNTIKNNIGKNFITNGNSILFAFEVGNNYGYADSGVILGAIADKSAVFPKTPYVTWVNKCNIYVFSRDGKLSLYDESIKIEGLSQNPSYEKLYDITDKYDIDSYDVTVSDMSYNVNVVFEKNLDMRTVRRVQGVLNAMMVFFFILIAYFFYSMYITRLKPIKAISDLLQIDIDKIDYRLIEKPIKSIVDKNAILNSMMEDKDTMLRSVVFDGLLKGDINKDILSSENHGIKFEYNGFIVVVINIYRDSELSEDENKELIKTFEDAISDMVSDEKGVPYFVSKKQYLVCIYNTDKDFDLKQLGLKFAYLIKILEIDFEFVASVAVSDIHEGYWQIPMAYYEALEVINRVDLFNKSKVAFYKDIAYKNNRFKFDINDEAKLTEAIRNGDKNSASEVINKVIDRIDMNNTFAYTNISVGLIYSLMRIADTLFGENYDTGSISVLLKNDSDPHILRSSLISFAEKMCDDRAKNTEDVDLAKAIQEFIHDNYSNPQMSVEYISNNLSYSVVHIHNTFRKKYGKTVIAYLNYYRIEQAKKLICEDMKISEVANAVGISSIRTFNRLFQSITGMTPTEYKEYRITHKEEPKNE